MHTFATSDEIGFIWDTRQNIFLFKEAALTLAAAVPPASLSCSAPPPAHLFAPWSDPPGWSCTAPTFAAWSRWYLPASPCWCPGTADRNRTLHSLCLKVKLGHTVSHSAGGDSQHLFEDVVEGRPLGRVFIPAFVHQTEALGGSFIHWYLRSAKGRRVLQTIHDLCQENRWAGRLKLGG